MHGGEQELWILDGTAFEENCPPHVPLFTIPYLKPELNSRIIEFNNILIVTEIDGISFWKIN